MPDEIYESTLESINEELLKLKIEKTQRGDDYEVLNEYVSYGVNMLTNMDALFDKADINRQHKLLGSYFDRNLVFDGKNYEP